MRWRRSARGAVLLLLVLVASISVDAVVHDLTFRFVVSHGVRLAANGFTQLGTAWPGVGVLVALGVHGHRVGDAALLRSAAGGVLGIALAAVAGQVAKQVTCWARPGLLDGWGVGPVGETGGAERRAALNFFNWPCLTDSRHHGFPSGHTTTAFAVAAALSHAIPSGRRLWVGAAAGVGTSSVLLNAHFLSDVLGGALIGWWAGQAGQALVRRLGVPLGRSGSMASPVDPAAGSPRA